MNFLSAEDWVFHLINLLIDMLHLDSLNGVKFAIWFEHRYTQQSELDE